MPSRRVLIATAADGEWAAVALQDWMCGGDAVDEARDELKKRVKRLVEPVTYAWLFADVPHPIDIPMIQAIMRQSDREGN